MIDAERVVGEYLRDHPSVAADIVGRTPSATSGPWITLQQLDARAIDEHRSDHAIDYLLQLSIYAGGQQQVWTLALAARAALRDMPGTHDGAVITGVRFAGMARVFDSDFKAKERVVLTANVYAHPA